MQLLDGEIRPAGSWVYVWVRPGGEIVYIGATGLPLATRVWLHLNDERPEVGRIRASRPEVLVGEVEVRGFAVDAGLDRGAVRDCLETLLADAPNAELDRFDEATMAEAGRIRAALTE